MTIYDVTEAHPETIRVLVDSGFPRMEDQQRRRAQGRALTVEAAARLRKMDPEALVGRLNEAVEDAARCTADVTLSDDSPQLLPAGDVRISGLLPCPVRLPILEAVRDLARRLDREQGLRLGWSLSAASVGADRLNEQIARVTRPDELPELFVSAGFESFFDRRNLGRFAEAFADMSPLRMNPALEALDLRDPRGNFTMLAVVPAVFLVNHATLGGAEVPRTWAALLGEAYRRRVALPIGDFDLFNAILLTLYRQHGEAAVRSLGRSMLVGLHPSQTVGRFAAREAHQPAVSIVPYFFSKMTATSRTLEVVWPEDGAIVSPIFMLVRQSALPAARPAAELFLARETGEVLAHRGLFPSTHPEVDNRLPQAARLAWLGWDFIREQDIGALIPRLRRLFDEQAEVGS